SAPSCDRIEALDTASHSQSHEQAKIPHAVLIAAPPEALSIRKTSWPLISDNLESCDACPPAAILGHENLETLPSVGARIPRIRLAGDPLCSDLCLGLLPTTSLIGM